MSTITMKHCRKLRYCSRGVREVFNRYGLDYNEFLKNGIPSEKFLEATNYDTMVKALAEVADGEQQ